MGNAWNSEATDLWMDVIRVGVAPLEHRHIALR